MSTNKQWKDLFNNTNNVNNAQLDKQIKSDFMIINDIIKSNNNGFYIREKIPQSVIKKSIKDAYKK
jgi:hypothetical protein